MTTKDTQTTWPSWPKIRLTNGYVEVSDTVDFSSNTSWKWDSVGIRPSQEPAPIAAAPATLQLRAQDGNAGFAANGGAISLITGIGSVGQPSGLFSLVDSAGNAGWNTAHYKLGIYHLWIDAANRLRIKNSIPVSDLDGNVVGIDLSGSATFDPPSLVDGAGATTTVTVTGAVLGDFAIVSFSLDLQGIIVTAYVSAANTVSVRFQNETGGTLDLASGTLRARVIKQ